MLLTHDVKTMADIAYSRVRSGKSMPGVVEVSRRIPVAVAIEELILLTTCSLDDEWEGRVLYLPLT